MKKLTTLILMVVVCGATWGQNLEVGNVIEYNLPSEDNNTGTFYLGKFLIGQYEISANITGIHANNTGWKIFIGSNWSGSNLQFQQVFNNVNGVGDFIYQREGDAYFHLWWDSKYGSGGQMWTPHIKVQYQAGNCIYNSPEPQRLNYKILESTTKSDICYTESLNVTDGESKFVNKNGRTLLIERDNEDCWLTFHDPNDAWFSFGIDRSNNGYLTLNNTGTLGYRPDFVMATNGNVGIGTFSPNSKLDVAGNIKAHEIEVTLASMQDLQLNGTLAANNITYTANGNTADFVFEDNYQLKDLSEVEAFIKANKHLPEIPSAAQMEATGVNLAEMNKLLLMKVEELTLYMIEQQKEINLLKEKLNQ